MKQSASLFAIFFTFFIDALCWAIVFPIFAPYFLNPETPLFTSATSPNERATFLALFLALFSLGQFLGAPWIGEFADRFGRKNALIITVLFTFIGLLITSWSTQNYQLTWLMIGRSITGFFASNVFICQTCVADLSPDETVRSHRFGLLASLIGVSFVVGSFVGGKLSDASISSLFSPSLPLWIASFLSLMNLFFVVFAFKETKHVDKNVSFDLFIAFKNLKIALRTKGLREVFGIYFLFLLSWMILFLFIPVLGVRDYSFSESNIGDLALFMGICWIIGSGYLNRIFKRKSTLFLMMAFNLLYFFIIIPKKLYAVLIILGICVILAGIIWPIYTTLLSSLGKEHMRGKILGLSQSVQSGAMTLAPLIASAAFQKSFELPFLIGAIISLLGTFFYWKYTK